MKKLLFLCGILMMLPCAVVAQNFDINVEKGKRIISCTRSYGAQDQDLEFAKVMKWAIDRGEMHRDGIKAIDHFSRTLVTDFAWDDDDIKFTSKLQIQVTKSQLIFTFFDVLAQGGGFKGLIGLKLDFNKINPEKKEKHKQMQDLFLTKAQQAVTVSYNSIEDSRIRITNWENVVNGSLQKGMTIDEAYLIYGKPVTINSRDNETQVEYNSFTHVLFIDDKVVRIF